MRDQVIGAAAEYYDKVAQSSLEVECKAMKNLWNAMSRIERDPSFKLVEQSQSSCKSVNNPTKRLRLRPVFAGFYS